jgi:hypothetical protein
MKDRCSSGAWREGEEEDEPEPVISMKTCYSHKHHANYSGWGCVSPEKIR